MAFDHNHNHDLHQTRQESNVGPRVPGLLAITFPATFVSLPSALSFDDQQAWLRRTNLLDSRLSPITSFEHGHQKQQRGRSSQANCLVTIMYNNVKRDARVSHPVRPVRLRRVSNAESYMSEDQIPFSPGPRRDPYLGEDLGDGHLSQQPERILMIISCLSSHTFWVS